MARFRVGVVWQMMGYVEVEAKDEAEAIQKAGNDQGPLPKGDYLDDSFQADPESVRKIE